MSSSPRFAFIILLLLHIAPPAFSQAVSPPRELPRALAELEVLSPGRSLTWNAPLGAAITVSDGAVVSVRDLGAKIKVTGKKVGSAVIRSGLRSLEVQVVGEATYRFYDDLRRTIVGQRGLELDTDGKTVRVKGRLLRLDDWRALARAHGGAPGAYFFTASMTDDLAQRAREHFRALLREAHLPDLTLDVRPHASVTLPAEPADLKKRVEQVLGPYGFRIEVSSAALSLEPLVRVRIIVAEIRKSLRTQFGIKWPSAAEAQLLPSPAFASGETLALTLQALEDRGQGKVLASPTLLSRSGKEAQFWAGGEFPIRVAGRKTKEVVWKKHGVLLNIKPVADATGRMSIAIQTEVSMIDMSQAVDGVPGVSVNRIESHFDLAQSRTIALSGLIKQQTGEASSGLPGLSSLPVLGPLFSSREYIEQKSELVFFVTPEVAKPESENL